MITDSGYRQVDHTGDLALELWAPSEEELLLVGARAIIDILTNSTVLDTDSTRQIEIDAVDREDRFVQWLNEVIVAAITDGFVIVDADIALHGNALSARARGHTRAEAYIVTELKSATYHALNVQPVETVWRAYVVIDT